MYNFLFVIFLFKYFFRKQYIRFFLLKQTNITKITNIIIHYNILHTQKVPENFYFKKKSFLASCLIPHQWCLENRTFWFRSRLWSEHLNHVIHSALNTLHSELHTSHSILHTLHWKYCLQDTTQPTNVCFK